MKTARIIRRASSALFAAAAFAVSPSSTAAESKYWQGGAGNWDNAAAWQSAGQPKAGDYVNIAQNYANITYVNTAYPNAILYNLTLDATNTASLTIAQHVLSADGEYIGSGWNGAVVQSGGSNNITGGSGLNIAYNAGSSGSYALTGSGALNVSSFEFVGRLGVGIFNQTGGTHNVVGTGKTLTVGGGPDGSGTYNLSGGTLHTGSTTLSSDGAAATFTHSAGTHTVDNFLELSDGLSPHGPVLYTLSNTGILNAGYEFVGGIGAATFNQSGGVNNCSIELRMGNNDGATGTYNLSGGTLNLLNDFTVGASGQGIFNATGGKVVSNKVLVVGLFATGKGAFNMSNGASVQVPAIDVGSTAIGNMNITGGTLTNSGDFNMAGGHGSATVNLSGGSVSSQSLYMSPDVLGKAVFNHNGGVNTVSGMFILGQRGSYNLSGGAFTVGQTVMAPGGTMKITGGQFKTTSLQFQDTASGAIDITNKSFVVDYDQASGLPQVKDSIITGYKSGAWSGPGIQSSAAAGDASKKTAVGYGEASKILGLTGNNTAQWQGQTVDATTVLVSFTKYGDANLDGAVGFADLVKVAQNYGTLGGQTWADGDFNFDSNVDFMDLVKVAQNYNSVLPAAPIPGVGADFDRDVAAAFSNVPEPGAAALLLPGATVLLATRRRRRLPAC